MEGRLHTRSYDDKDGKKQYFTEVVAEDVILLGGRTGEAAAGAGDFASSGPGPVSMPRSQRPPAAAPAENISQEISDDDVPF